MNHSLPVACEEFVAYLDKIFPISLNDIKGLIVDFHSEMQKGLSGHESSLKMIPAFVDKPKGNEKGEFIALDLGGTNFRVLTVQLDGKGSATVQAVSKFAISKKNMQGTGLRLFDFIADCIDSFLTENSMDRNKFYNLAFTFSFPVKQANIADGKLIVWTKGFTATGVKGKDVIMLLNEALKRKNINCIKVTALANDTVGTLVARSYMDPTCDMGVIMGTGTNACYREKCSKIEKLREPDSNGHMIVNMEWGNFDKCRPTWYDKELDRASVNPGAMHLEKMVSGMYLGEVTRLVLVDLIKRDLIFLHKPDAVESFKRQDSLKTAHMSLIEGDESKNLVEVEAFLNHAGISNVTLHDRIVIKRLCKIVSLRAARLGAAAISAVITWMDLELEDKHTVGIDGSLFEKYHGFGSEMRAVFEELYGAEGEKITLVHSKDGSGKGAAIIAAVAATAGKMKRDESKKIYSKVK